MLLEIYIWINDKYVEKTDKGVASQLEYYCTTSILFKMFSWWKELLCKYK